MADIIPFTGQGGDLRQVPHSVAAEAGVLGSILRDSRAYDAVVGFLRTEHFASPLHARIYAVICSLVDRGEPADPVTVHPYLAADELLDQAGGMKYLARLVASLVTHSNVGAYGRVVYDAWVRRRTLEILSEGMERAYAADAETPAEAEVDMVEQQLFELAAFGSRVDSLRTAGAAATSAVAQIMAAYHRGGGTTGTPTCLRDLDGKLAGLHPSDLIILAGRPSMGKTALATVIAYNAARYFRDTDREEDQGKQVAFFSLEMSAEQLMGRLISYLANIDHHKLRNGYLTTDEVGAIARAEAEIATLPLHIDDQPATSASAIRVRCRRLARRSKKAVGLCVVDYLQLMAPPAKTTRDQNRVQEVSAITGGLKACAKSLKIPVLALSQLSRALESREDKRPQLSDLRESGTIEQDADVVMFVYRDEYYLQRAEPKNRADETDARHGERLARWQAMCEVAANKAEVIIGKQRHGPIGTVELYFDAKRTWFEDLETRADAYTPKGGPAGPAPPPHVREPEQMGMDLGARDGR